VVALFDAQSYPVPDGGLLVLFSEVSTRERQARELAERSAENERLRELARTMAAVADSAAVLDALCAAAITLCGAAGATVAEVLDDEARFIAVANHPPAVRGHRFPLAGTLTGRLLALEQQAAAAGPAVLLRADASGAEDAAFCGDLADGRRVGDLLLAPLAAHGEMLGVLAVSRAQGEAPFGPSDEACLRVVADHASLALHKARLVEAAQEANTTKSAFLATVSHELRTPLTALTGYGELLADEILGPLTVPQADVVERMRVVTHQLTAMIEEILTFSALEAGREVVRPAPVDVAEVVHAVAAVVEPLAEQKALAFEARVPPVPPPLVTDPDKLRQILVNLCGNAGQVHGRRVGVARRGGHRPRRAVPRARHRGRHRSVRPRPPLPRVHAARQGAHAAVRRHRARPLHLPAARPAAGRPHRRRVRAGRGVDVLAHAPAAPAGGPGRAARQAPGRGGPRRYLSAMTATAITSVFNDAYIAEVYEAYRRDPASVDGSWRQHFETAEQLARLIGAGRRRGARAATGAADAELLRKTAAAAALVPRRARLRAPGRADRPLGADRRARAS
jgi:signal transduction histidine kinase